MPHAAVVFLAIVGAASLCFFALASLAALAVELTRAAGRRRLRGGNTKRLASYGQNQGVTYTTSATTTNVVYFSSRRPPGTASAGVATRPKPPQPSSPIALTYFGPSVAAGRSPGQRQGLAG